MSESRTAPLAGRTLFITGASRGIGLAIALRAAADGANIAIAAKTTEPHPKLPGTIYTAAAEIEAALRCRGNLFGQCSLSACAQLLRCIDDIPEYPRCSSTKSDACDAAS